MAGTTPVYGFPYPTSSDIPAGHTQIQSLATAVEGKFVTNDATVAGITGASSVYSRGRVGGATSSTDTPVSTTESIILSCTFTAVAGRRYKLTCDFEYYRATGTPNTDNMYHKLRIISGSTPTATGGTVVRAKAPNCPSGGLFLTTHGIMLGTWVAPSSGTFAVSFTARMLSGTGGIAGGLPDHNFEVLVEDIGV